MNYLARAASVIVVGFLATTALCAHPNGPGGGHGGGHGGSSGHGSGGHGFGGHGGHARAGPSAGNSSGHSILHSMGRPFGRIFARHVNQPASVQHPTALPNRGNLLKSLNTESIFLPPPRLLRPRPFPRSHSQRPFRFFPRHRRFGFGGCPLFAVPGNRFFFGNSFDCFHDSFFFYPFFFTPFWGPSFYGPWLADPSLFGGADGTPATILPDEESGSPNSPTDGQSANDFLNSQASAAPLANPDDRRTVTLLQLRDGSMYGLTDYWVEDGELHYTTTYGGQNSVPFTLIDFEKTFELNADRGVPFLLRPNHASP